MNAPRLLRFATATIVLSFLFGCSDKKELPLLELLPPDKTGIGFSNQLTESEALNIITFEYFYNGAGVGIGDINNDGLKDIFFSANMTSNRLYLNKGNLTFEDITDKAGIHSNGKWATGVSVVDINQDGWLDIYVCFAGPFADAEQRANELYLNNKDNTFTESAKLFGLADTGHSVQAAFFDYDLDGDLDAYLLTNITDQTGPNIIRPKRIHGEMENTDRLYRNNGDGIFTNVSQLAGITIEGYGLGVSIADINGDHWPDIYVSNDYLSNDLLYMNNGDGTFTDRAAQYFKHTSYSAMGNDVADFNNDALPDIITVDMLPPDNKRQKLMFGSTNYDRYRSEIMYCYSPQFMRNTLQLNAGLRADSSVLFSEIGQLAGVHATDWSWSALFADIDNDGWKDLLITNGYPRDITNRDFASYKANEFMRQGYNESVMKSLMNALGSIEGAYLPNFIFQNNKNLTFSDRSSTWGFTPSSYSTGAAYADLDNDGDLDFVVNNINAPAFVYKNNAERISKNHFLNIHLEGPNDNSTALGAKVWVYNSDSVQYFEHSPYRGFQSTVETGVHVGLGKAKVVDSVIIRWPNGKHSSLVKVAADQTLSVKYADAQQKSNVPVRGTAPYFEKGSDYGIHFVHHESHYVDFKIQPLLPQKYSQGGPGIAVGDVNGDGLEDSFVGGAFRQSGQIFVQQKGGGFKGKPLSESEKFEEDMGALLFDPDGDGDQDLYVSSGGNEFQDGSPYYRDRLYANDGRGNFALQNEALPDLRASGSCVIANDFDRDGDLDLFAGGRLTPQHFPLPGQSFILENRQGRFTDVTDRVAPGLRNVGMVSSALWTDADNDGETDLIIVGEWMPITIFQNKAGKFTSYSLPNTSGWWNSITGADFDKDGDIDYVIGNLGLNTRYKASDSEPVSVYTDDLNRDGVQDPVMAHYIQGVKRPAHPRDDLLAQITQYKRRYPSYLSYAEATIDAVLGVELEKQKGDLMPAVLQCQTFASSYLENKGSDGWLLKPLPIKAQFAPMFGVVAGEFTRDDNEDILMTGNSYAPDVLTGQYDALNGLLLRGDGSGNFEPISHQRSGILIDGDAKGLAILETRIHTVLLAAQNNDSLKVIVRAATGTNTLPIRDDEVYAIVIRKDGKKSKHEFYYGSGYLSQSSRLLRIPEGAQSVAVFGSRGKSRVIRLK